MRLVVTVSPIADLELHSDLERLPSRRRAERLRALSILGLSAIKGGGYKVQVSEPLPSNSDNRKDLVTRLKGTLQP